MGKTEYTVKLKSDTIHWEAEVFDFQLQSLGFLLGQEALGVTHSNTL